MNKTLIDAATKTVNLLKDKKLSVAAAESCTGGMVAQFITAVPGASEVFELAITSYSNRIKHTVLGVEEDILAQYGAVSKSTAAQMAVSIRSLAQSDIGVSVTGVAGPEPSEGKQPGLVYIALADKESVTVEELKIEPISRDYVRQSACKSVFTLIQKTIEKGSYS